MDISKSYLIAFIAISVAAFGYVSRYVVSSYFGIFTSTCEIVKNLARENQIFQMILLSAGGYFVAVSGMLLRKFTGPLIGGLWSSITIENKDSNFDAVVDYIADKLLIGVQGGQNSMQASTLIKKKSGKDWKRRYLGTEDREVDVFEFRPDSNTAAYKLLYKGTPLYLSRTKGAPLMGGNSSRPFTPETLTLSVWGQGIGIIKELLQEALAAHATKENVNNINIYVQSTESWLSGWELAMTKKARDKHSVILDMDLLEKLLEDANKFLQSGKWYLDLGIPYRRGYLLYGPPGCGKTSFAQVLAGELQLDLCILNLSHEGLDDNKLAAYFRDAPSKSIIVLEDVDSVFVEREVVDDAKRKGNSCNVSFSGLLNAIDGVASQEGRLFFMTTNHIEKLDPALIRPGRCDVQLELKRASKLQMERMFLRFFPGELLLSKEFSKRLPANEISMAALQGHLLKFRKPQECVDGTLALLQESKPNIKPLKSVYEHLRRVGLETYAPILEYHGITNTINLAGFTVQRLEQLSVEFSYDTVSQQVLKKLLDDEDDFMRNSYAFAEIATIREMFLATYPTDHEQYHGERAPIFRRQTSLGEVTKTEDDAPINPSPVMKMIRGLSSDKKSSLLDKSASSPVFADLMHRSQTQYSHEELDALCTSFCEILTRNGKGVISHYNLRLLLSSFPKRPAACVDAAKAFVRDRLPNEVLATHLDLYDFLKRAGCAEHLYSLKVSTLPALLKKGKDKNALDLQQEWIDIFQIDAVDAMTLAEIVTKTESVAGSLMKFQLPSSARIMQCFKLFFTVGEGAPKAALSSISETPEAKSVDAIAIDISAATQQHAVSPAEIDNMAFSFARAVTNDLGRSRVSLIEIEKHLLRHCSNPLAALETIDSELLHPAKPSPKPRPPPPPVPTDWVVDWLKSAGIEYVAYANNFINEGLSTEVSLSFGEIFTDEVLSKVLGVQKLGHRRKIIAMHGELLSRAVHKIEQVEK